MLSFAKAPIRRISGDLLVLIRQQSQFKDHPCSLCFGSCPSPNSVQTQVVD
jgi:hypothetical protein